MQRPRALITGASAGLGRDYAALFAADGFDLILVARRKDRLEALAAELRAQHGADVLVVAADLNDPAAPQAIFAAVQAADLDVEALVNNAGFGSNGPFWEQPLDGELGQVQVNIAALVHLTRLFLPPMLERRRGRILNIGSTAGFQPGPYMATYCATKAFVNHFTEALAFELDGTGVTATVHCPGPTHTEFGDVSGNGSTALFKVGVASSLDVAQHGYLAMKRGARLAVHGALNKLVIQSNRLTPRALTLAVAARLLKPGA
jgi:short-subunit dehydrogenase